MEQRRQAIVDAAAEIFGEQGYERTTLENIGDAVGLSKTSLYYYVDSKEELLALLLVDVIGAIEEEYARRGGGGGGPIEELRAIIESHCVIVCTHPAGRVLGENLDLVLGDTRSEMMAVTRQEYVDRLIGTLRAGTEQGMLSGAEPPIIARLLLGALNTIPRWYRADGPNEPEEIAGQLLTMVLNGLCAPDTAGDVAFRTG